MTPAIEPASAIGFALAFIGATWAASIVCGVIAAAAAPWLRRVGPEAERRAATCAILAGPAMGAAIAGTLAVRSLASAWLGWVDHCPQHSHHLHLCWFHGEEWGHASWAVALLAALGTVVAARMLLATIDVIRAKIAIRRIARAATEIAPGVWRVASRRAFCFVASNRVFVSSAAWDALDEDERAAVIAHERAHLERGDLRARAWLGAMALFGAPWMARRALVTWRRATEKLCDRAAAGDVGEETTVAQALVKMARLAGAPSPGMAFVPAPSEVEERVEALLAAPPTGAAAARRMSVAMTASFVVAAAAAIALADPLHHAIESLFGAL